MIVNKINRPLLVISVLFTICLLNHANAETGLIKGVVMLDNGEPMPGGIISFFKKDKGPPPALDKYWRIPDFQAALSLGGDFSAALPEGEYYIEALMRVSSVYSSPPADGDSYYSSTDDHGRPKAYSVKAGETVDLGIIVGTSRLIRMDSKQITGVKGIITDDQGNLLKGLIVLADDRNKGTAYMSDVTGSDGSFTVRVFSGGEYVISVIDAFSEVNIPFAVQGYEENVISISSEDLMDGVIIMKSK